MFFCSYYMCRAGQLTWRADTILMRAVVTLAEQPRCDTECGDAMTSNDAEIRALLDSWADGIRKKDIDRLMSVYSPDIVYFDVVPPLQIKGSDAVRRNFLRWFDIWSSSIGQDIRDLNIEASGDVAVAYMLIRASGTLKNGREVGYWVRASVSCRRSNDQWLLTHEHVSVPVDFQGGTAVMDLVP